MSFIHNEIWSHLIKNIMNSHIKKLARFICPLKSLKTRSNKKKTKVVIWGPLVAWAHMPGILCIPPNGAPEYIYNEKYRPTKHRTSCDVTIADAHIAISMLKRYIVQPYWAPKNDLVTLRQEAHKMELNWEQPWRWTNSDNPDFSLQWAVRGLPSG